MNNKSLTLKNSNRNIFIGMSMFESVMKLVGKISILFLLLIPIKVSAWKMESGTVNLKNTHVDPNFTTVTFQQQYDVVPLVFAIATNDGEDPCALRIKNITTTGFEIAQVEPTGENGPHASMTIHYFAIEPGIHHIPGGITVIADTLQINTIQHGSGVPGPTSWSHVNFPMPFSTPPAILAMIQGLANETGNIPGSPSVPWLTVALTNISNSNFQIALERSEVADGGSISDPEKVAYVAFSQGSGEFYDNSGNLIKFEAIRSSDAIQGWDNGCFTVNFSNSYSSSPNVIATKNTRDGGDGGWLRRCSLTNTSVGLTVDEDRYRDSERSHTTERAGIVVFSQDFYTEFFEISGTIYEDVIGDGDIDAQDVGIEGVEVYIYRDNGNGIPDAGDQLLSNTTTNTDGEYNFSVESGYDYFIVVNSKSINPPAGYNSGYGLGNVWAEQTYGAGGSWGGIYWDHDADPSTAPQTRTSNGPAFGGRYGNRSDDPSSITTAEHIAKVQVNNSDVSGVDFGFSFNVVTNVNDQDDDASNSRTCQGCLRQFIQNSKAITGANHMRFVPTVPPNQGSGSTQWWQVTINSSLNYLPQITDNATTIDGTAYWYNNPSVVRNSNEGQVGTGGTVGVDEIPLPQFERKELEININDHDYGFVVNSDSDTFKSFAIYNANKNAFYVTLNNWGLFDSLYIGPRADGSEPIDDDKITWEGLLFYGTNSFTSTIKNCYVAYIKNNGVGSSNQYVSVSVDSCEMAYNGLVSTPADGIDVIGSWVIKHSLFHHNGSDNSEPERSGAGVELGRPNSGYISFSSNDTIINCTMHDNAQTGINILDSVVNVYIYKNIIYHNGYGYNTGHPGTGIKLTFPDGNKKIEGIRISQNLIYDNESIAIDIVTDYSISPSGAPDGVTPNDGTLYATNQQPNRGMDYPIFTEVRVFGGNLHIEGYVGSSSQRITGTHTVEVFKAYNDGNNDGEIEAGDGLSVPHGEGRWFIGSCTTNSDGTFDCDVTIPPNVSLSLEDSITATATDENGNTSEFGPNALVAIPISGRIFEDVDGQGDAFETEDEGKQGVSVRLYLDSNGNKTLDSGDEFVDEKTTDANGIYTFYLTYGDTTFFVVVNSKDIMPKGGYNDNYGPDTVWAEQTFEREYIEGSYSAHTEFGGESPVVSDSFSLTSTDVDDNRYEHVARVDVGSSAVEEIDFGFNFDVVVNTLDEDQDAASQRFAQGSLRQFIINANGIKGGNHMRFVPAVPTNEGSGSNNWWAISLNAAPPVIIDSATVLDGTVYNHDDGTTILNTNPGQVGTGGTVGIGDDGIPGTGDEATIPLFELPELEINGSNTYRFTVSGERSIVRKIAFYRSALYLNADSVLVEDNLVGMKADATTPSATSTWYGIEISGDDDFIHVRHNYLKIDNSGIRKEAGGNTSQGCVIEYNEVDVPSNGQSDTFDAILFIIGGSQNFQNDTARYNLAKNQRGSGIEVGFGGGTVTDLVIENNTIIHNGYIYPNTPSSENTGIVLRKLSSNSRVLIKNNEITQSSGPGIGVQSTATRVTIRANSIYNNGGISIDFDPDDADPNGSGAGDGVTPNDGTTGTGANNGMDYPIFTKVTLTASNLHIEGYVGTSSQHISGTHTIEIYKPDDDGNNNGEIEAGDGLSVPHGEGRWSIGSCTTNPDGTFDCDITVPSVVSLAVGDSITATATDANGNTSEFGPNTPVASAVKIDGYVYHDVNHNLVKEMDEDGISGIRVELWRWNGTSWVLNASTTTDDTGYYSFSPPNAGQYRIIEDFNDNAGSDPNNGSDSTGYVSTTPNVIEISWTEETDERVNFGDFHGSKLRGYVFYDAQCGVQTPDNNDGEMDAGEAGIEGVTVKVVNSSGDLVDETQTANDGSYNLWVGHDVSLPFYLVELNPSGFVSTGDYDGQAIHNAHINDADTVEFSSFTSGTEYTGYNFGDVPEYLFEPDHSGTGMPGTPVTYRHFLVSPAQGYVRFNITSERGWTWILIHDINGDGIADASDTVITTTQFYVVPCETLNLILRGFIPSNEPLGVMEITKLDAVVSYANHPVLEDSLQVVDITGVSGPLKLTKTVDKRFASPGDILTYTITFKNIGIRDINSVSLTDPISNFVNFVHDAFGSGRDVEFHYPDGSTVYLTAEDGSDSNNDGAWIMSIGNVSFLRVDFDNLPTPINSLMPAEEGYLLYEVEVK